MPGNLAYGFMKGRPAAAFLGENAAEPAALRSQARRVVETARARERHGGVEQTARVLGIDRFEVEGRLRMRRALRSLGPYRYAACSRARSR